MDELLLKFSSMPNLDEVFVDEEQLFRPHHGTRSKRSSISSKSVAFDDPYSLARRGSVVSENVRFDGRPRGNESVKMAYQEKKIHELEKMVKEKNQKIKQLNKRYIDILNMANEREKSVATFTLICICFQHLTRFLFNYKSLCMSLKNEMSYFKKGYLSTLQACLNIESNDHSTSFVSFAPVYLFGRQKVT